MKIPIFPGLESLPKPSTRRTLRTLGEGTGSGKGVPGRRARLLGLAVVVCVAMLASPIALSATFTVTTTADAGDGSLRQAILDANANVRIVDTIRLQIPGVGVRTIAPESALPQIVDPVTIEADASNLDGNGRPYVRIDRASANPALYGLDFATPAATSSSVTGVALTRWNNGNGAGIHIAAGGTVKVTGSLFGTDATGAASEGATSLGNYSGIAVENASEIGSAAGAVNVLSNNQVNGVLATGGALVRNNWIGVGLDGRSALPNGVRGVFVQGANVAVGGVSAAERNVIEHNGGAGVEIASGSSGVAVFGNEIDANGGRGIVLGSSDSPIPPNDPLDADAGPNGLQNFPLVSGASTDGTTLQLAGRLGSAAGATYDVDVYASPSCDPSGNGEAAVYLGRLAPVVTDGSGSASFTGTVRAPTSGETVVTVTATASDGSTSELSPCATISAAAGTLLGARSAPGAGSADLTAEGATDWAVWGYAAGGTSTSLDPNVRRSGGSAISSLTDVNPGGVPLRGLGQFGPDSPTPATFPFTFSWSNGAPTASASGALTGLQHNGGPPLDVSTIGSGFRFTVPADTTSRTLKLWVALNRAGGQLTASLSDESAVSYSDSFDVGAGDFVGAVYTLTYRAASAGQTLTVSWIENVDNCAAFRCDNVSIHAVALDLAGENPQSGSTYTVNTADDHDDGTCGTTDCTLREAIVAANKADGQQTIAFAIPGGGTQQIAVAAGGLPAITSPVTIDGETERAYLAGDGVPGNETPAGSQPIELDGDGAGASASGLVLAAGSDGSTIHGLDVQNFQAVGISVASSGNTVRASYVGTTSNGLSAQGNGVGILVLGGSNVLGGPAAADRLVVAGNTGDAQIRFTGGTSGGNTLQGSYVGLGRDGTTSLPGLNGIVVENAAHDTTIGGDWSAGEGNLIHGFGEDAVLIDTAGTGNVVAGNGIGVDASGTTGALSGGIGIEVRNTAATTIGDSVAIGAPSADPSRGNVIAGATGDAGILVSTGATATTIAANFVGTDRTATASLPNGEGIRVLRAGDNAIGPFNTIAFNEGAGVEIAADGGGASDGNRISANAIHDNGGLGIELVGGANRGLAAPSLVSVTRNGNTTTIEGTVAGPPSSLVYVEFFVSDSCDPSGRGEGATYAFFAAPTTDSFGRGTFSFDTTAPATGQVVSATATNAVTSDTSAFSSCESVPGSATIEAVTIAASAAAVEAAGKVPLANVPPAAFLGNGASNARSAPVNDIPINEVQLRDSPVNDIPINDVGLSALAPELGDVLLSTVPLLRAGGWEAVLAGTSLAQRPIQNVTLKDVLTAGSGVDVSGLTLADLDLSHSPLGQISAVAWSLGGVTLGQLDLAGTTWCQALSGPPVNCTSNTDIAGKTLLQLGIEGAPINDVPVNEIPVNDVPINDIPINDVPINDITVRGTPINDIPINDVPVNDVPVNDVPINDIPVNEIPINDVATRTLPINEIPVNEIPVNEIPVNDVPVNDVPVNDVPVNEIPIDDVPVNEIPIDDILLGTLPVNDVPIDDIPVNDIADQAALFSPLPAPGTTLGQNRLNLRPGVTLGDLRRAHAGGDLPATYTLGSLAGWGGTTIGDLIAELARTSQPPKLSQIVSLLKLYTGTTPPKPTFGDLFELLVATDRASTSVNLDLTDLAHLLFGTDATLADLLATVLSSSDLGWERLDLAGLGVAQYAAAPPTVDYTAVVSLAGTGTPSVSLSVTLPEGFTYAPGSSRYAGTSTGFDETTLADPAIAGRTLTWTFTKAAPSENRFTFSAYPGIRLGPTSTTASATLGSAGPVEAPTPAAVEVATNLEPSGLGAPQPIASDEFVLSYVSSKIDGDVYSLPAPPVGSRVTIRFSHLPADYDLVVYGPGGQVLVPAAPGTVPLDGQPLADTGTSPTSSIDALPAQTLDDVPIDAGRTVIGISANRGTQDDAVTFLSQGTGQYLIQVSGFNGAVSTEPYMVRAEVLPPRVPAICAPRAFTLPGMNAGAAAAASEVPDPVPAGVDTVFVVNRQQLARIYGDTDADATIAAIRTRLAILEGAGYPSALLQVDAVQAVRDATAGWNGCPSDPTLANDVVVATGARIRAFKAAHPSVRYVVVVGDDDVIPFARLDDRTTLSNEDSFAGSFAPSAPIGGSLAGSKMLSDDPYGTLAPVPFFDRQLYVPELAVGRLVETPVQIQAQLAAFAARPGGAVTGSTALTTGYDFLTDGAQRVSGALAAVAPANGTLIPAPNVPASPNWSASDLGAALASNGGQPPAFVSINAHADDSRFQAANGTLYTTDDVVAAALTFDGRIVFSMGCHAGLNVPDAFLPPAGRRTDWAERLSAAGAAVVVANTGFGYGDSDVVAYSEDLNARFASHLAEGLTAGAALTQAKQEFQGDLGIVGVYDEKAMAELTLYGLPMVAVAGVAPQASAAGMQPLALSAQAVGAQALAAAALATTTTDPVTGLQAAEFSVVDGGLTSRAQSSSRGTYYRGRDGELVTHLRPIEPKATETIDAPNAHGALITGLTSEDVQPFDPLFARPIVDSSSSEPEIPYDEAAFPAKLQTVTSVKSFTGRLQKLVLAQGQFFSASSTDGQQGGFQRLFTSIAGQVFTSPSTDHTAPLFRTVDAVKVGDVVTFTADVDPGAADSAERVLVLYLDGSSGAWTPLDLQLVNGRWSGSATVAAAAVQYFVQAVDAAGNVAVSTNKGFYYSGEAAPPQGGAVTIAATGPQAPNGTFTGPVTVTADGPSGTTVLVSVDGGAFEAPPVEVTGNGTHTVLAKASNGDESTSAFVIDTAPPTATITDGPPAGSATTAGTATFTFTASEAATFECSVDEGGFAGCSSPVTVSGLADGRHVFRVRATDGTGNTGPQASRVWFVDRVPPTVTIDSGPADPSRSASASFAFGADETATFECAIDGGSFASCESPHEVTGLADGSHTFSVRGIDRAGNVGTPASRTWSVDTAAPVVTISSGPAEGSVLGSRSGSFAFSVNEPATVACSLDGGSYGTCATATTFAFSGLADGPHTFQARATDTAGNQGLSPLRSWTIDATGPTIAIASPVNGSLFAVGAGVTAHFGCSDTPPAPAPSCTGAITAGPAGLGPVASGGSLPTSQAGSYTLTVASTDQAGNTTVATSAYTVVGLQGSVAFVRADKVWAIPVGGGTPRQLTQTATDAAGTWIDEQPAVSPDGRRVVFARRPSPSAKPQLWVIDAAGRNGKRLVDDATKDYTAPAWAPSGDRIAFESTRTGSKGRDIWTAAFSPAADGTLSSFANRSNADGDDVTPDWGPGGLRIAFASSRKQGQFDIYTMLANGSNQQRLTNDRRADVEPSFSPSGLLIVFSSDRTGGFELFVMAGVNGSAQVRMTSSPGTDGQPHFVAPLSVVFTSAGSAAAGPGLYLIAPSAVPPVKLAGTGSGDRQPG